MTAATTLTEAELLHAEAPNGISYAYRRFGNAAAGVPLVFLQHFRGNIDNWDPALIDAIAADREVILFDNVGVGGTNGTTPATVEEMARDAVVFIGALGLDKVDLFGFSLGGFVAQAIALTHHGLVRRLILAGTGPKGAPGMEEWRPDVVISDIGLPALDGWELGRRVRAALGERAILVALTGYAQPADRERSLAAGYNHHLVKPVEPELLLRLLGSHPNGEDPAPQRRP